MHAVQPDMAIFHPQSGKPIGAVLFDLDGTLVDSAPDIAFALNTVLVKDGALPHSVDIVRTLIGEGIHRLVEKAYALHHRSLSLGDLNTKTANFAVIYEANIANETRPYPGVLAGLGMLKNKGVKTAIVSNKAQHLTDLLLHVLALSDRVDLILGARENLPKKPAPDMLLFALRALDVSADEAIFVGDSAADVKAAEAAHLPCILIEGGYTIEPATDLGAWHTVQNFPDFIKLLASGGMTNAAGTHL
jgi:phosphoglycolate phosphatase